MHAKIVDFRLSRLFPVRYRDEQMYVRTNGRTDGDIHTMPYLTTPFNSVGTVKLLFTLLRSAIVNDFLFA